MRSEGWGLGGVVIGGVGRAEELDYIYYIRTDLGGVGRAGEWLGEKPLFIKLCLAVPDEPGCSMLAFHPKGWARAFLSGYSSLDGRDSVRAPAVRKRLPGAALRGGRQLRRPAQAH